MKKSNPPLLLCDLDDTLIDNREAFAHWSRDFATRHQQQQDISWLMSFSDSVRGGSEGEAQFFEAIRARFHLRESTPELRDRYYKESIQLLRCSESNRRSLVKLRDRGWLIAIVTNGGKYQDQKIRTTGLDSLVDAWCVSDTEGYSKPDVRLLHLAADRCGADLSNAWLIGDNPDTDIAAANRANLSSAWIRHDRIWPRTDFFPSLQVDSFSEAVDLILTALSRGSDTDT